MGFQIYLFELLKQNKFVFDSKLQTSYIQQKSCQNIENVHFFFQIFSKIFNNTSALSTLFLYCCIEFSTSPLVYEKIINYSTNAAQDKNFYAPWIGFALTILFHVKFHGEWNYLFINRNILFNLELWTTFSDTIEHRSDFFKFIVTSFIFYI